MREELERLREQAASQIAAARDADTLERVELELLGRKQGKLTALLRGLGRLPATERKHVGALANEVRTTIERLIADKRRDFERGRMANLTESEWIDVTAPGQRPPAGHPHPISAAIRDITAIFERIGFIRVRHPEVDSDYYAFESLNMPPEHPARDEWETFFVSRESPVVSRIPSRESKVVSREERPSFVSHASRLETQDSTSSLTPQASRLVLTPHTSNGQVREMEKGVLPIRMVNIGKCYRREINATHTPMFHQFEGLLVDREVSVANLKGTLDYFVRSYFGPDRRTRLRPFHFQFTEPSFEIDISCSTCGGTGLSNRKTEQPDGGSSVAQLLSSSVQRCRTCKSGWLELGGAGMVHPNVLNAGGIDPEEYSGFAFGWGVERVLMMKAGIADIRLLYANDLRWLQQR